MDQTSRTSDLDVTVELPFEALVTTRRADRPHIDNRVDNPGVGAPTPGQGPSGPEIENPTETESDPQKSDTGPSSDGRPWS